MLQIFVSNSEDEYALFKKQVINPIMEAIKFKKPYERTRNSKMDEDDLIAQVNSFTPAVKLDGDESMDSQGNDLGFYKRDVFNERTKRTNQLFVCKYCGIKYTKLYNVKDHVHMHRGQYPYSCSLCGKVFS